MTLTPAPDSFDAPAGTMSGNAYPEDTFRILVATDNHIGYMEKDPIRGQDSINTFREILELAVKNDVDFVLLGGDLFHDNRPSRDTLYQVTALLREYCMNDRPIQIELLSDPNEGKAPGYSFPAINYEDTNLNVGMPVFSIHGNHDDPQGAGPEGALCALDMLSVSGLVNYIGKIEITTGTTEQGGGINIKPVLLRKGNSKLALYGIGNIKDARMHYELRSNRVRMYMPRDKNDWFNIMILHQNRVPHGPQNHVPEGMFDDSIDFVLWGHEHDCRVMPEEVVGKNYRICQPGSSVATSLADGESLEKQVALLEVQGKEYKLTPIPLRTVRPFVIDEVVLQDAAELENFALNDKEAVNNFLKSAVEGLIEQADKMWIERNERAKRAGDEELPRMLPLIRYKVDTTGVTETTNPVRLSQEFMGRVANPRDIFIFHRARKSRGPKIEEDRPELSIDDPELTAQEKLQKVRMRSLMQEFLKAQQVQVVAESYMTDALDKFIEKDDAGAVQQSYLRALKDMTKSIQINAPSDDDEFDDDTVESLAEKAKESMQKEKNRRQAEEDDVVAQDKGKRRAQDEAEAEDSMLEDIPMGGGSDFEASEPEPPKKTTAKGKKAAAPAKKAPAKKAPAKKAPAKRGKKVVSESEEEAEESNEESGDMEIVEVPKKRTNRAAVLGQTGTKAAPKKAPAKKTTASSSKQATLSFAPSQRAPRAAASKARKKTADMADSDSD